MARVRKQYLHDRYRRSRSKARRKNSKAIRHFRKYHRERILMSKLTRREQQYQQDEPIGEDPVPRHLRHRQICLTRQRHLRRLARIEELRAYVSTNAEETFAYDQEFLTTWSEENLLDFHEWKAARDAEAAEQAAHGLAAVIDFDFDDDVDEISVLDQTDYFDPVNHDEAELRLNDLNEYCVGGCFVIEPSMMDDLDDDADFIDATLIPHQHSDDDLDDELTNPSADDANELLRRHRKMILRG